MLMSVVAGEAVASIRTLEDKQVLQQCMAALRELFKEQVRETPGERGTLAVSLASHPYVTEDARDGGMGCVTPDSHVQLLT